MPEAIGVWTNVPERQAGFIKTFMGARARNIGRGAILANMCS